MEYVKNSKSVDYRSLFTKHSVNAKPIPSPLVCMYGDFRKFKDEPESRVYCTHLE